MITEKRGVISGPLAKNFFGEYYLRTKAKKFWVAKNFYYVPLSGDLLGLPRCESYHSLGDFHYYLPDTQHWWNVERLARSICPSNHKVPWFSIVARRLAHILYQDAVVNGRILVKNKRPWEEVYKLVVEGAHV